MKSQRNDTMRGRLRGLLDRIRAVKNIEIVIAAILAILAIAVYIGISFSANKASGVTSITSGMTEEEIRLSEMISRIDGVGEAAALITTGKDKEIVGVIVVAEGAKDIAKKVAIIRCVETATGATVDRIQVYQMANGG